MKPHCVSQVLTVLLPNYTHDTIQTSQCSNRIILILHLTVSRFSRVQRAFNPPPHSASFRQLLPPPPAYHRRTVFFPALRTRAANSVSTLASTSPSLFVFSMTPLTGEKTDTSKLPASTSWFHFPPFEPNPIYPPSGYTSNTIHLLPSEDTSKIAPCSEKRPIELLSESDSASSSSHSASTLPPRKRLKPNPRPSPSPRPPPTLRLALAIPPNPYPHTHTPVLIACFPSRDGLREPGFVRPTIQASQRVAYILSSCPLPPFLPVRLSGGEQVAAEQMLERNRCATGGKRGRWLVGWAFGAGAEEDGVGGGD